MHSWIAGLRGVVPPAGILVFIAAQIRTFGVLREVIPFVLVAMDGLAIAATAPATALTL
jgi:hypothetical protein